MPRFICDDKVRKNFSTLIGVVKSVELPVSPQTVCRYFVKFPDSTGRYFWESEITAA